MAETCMKAFSGSENDGFNLDPWYWMGHSGKLNLTNE